MSEQEEEKGSVGKRLAELRKLKEQRDKGEVFCIPFYENYPKMGSICPGIVKGIIYKITAGSGIGKTQFTKQMFCITPLEWMRKHPEKVKVKIFYFALEESKKDFQDSLLVNRLATKFGIRIDLLTLKMLREDYPNSALLDKLDKCQDDVQFYMDHIEVIDSVFNPTGLYKYCRDFSEKFGKHHWDKKTFMKKGQPSVEKVYNHYEQYDPDLHVIVITDHVSLITEEYDKKQERHLTKHQAMARWSTDYCLKQITKHWNWTAVNVQQQEQSNEKQQFTHKGSSIIQKTEPTLDGLANNKEIQRDDYVVISIYSPDKFGFTEYHDYDTGRFRDTFRAVKFLKNRLGVPNKYVHFLFDGATNRFIELPNPGEDDDRLEKGYKTADRLLGR